MDPSPSTFRVPPVAAPRHPWRRRGQNFTTIVVVGLVAAGATWAVQSEPTMVANLLDDGDPTRIVIPEIGVDAPMVPLGLDWTGRLQAPAGTSEVGWFRDGPEPGDRGAAVVAGHLDSKDGGAVFARLSEVAPGSTVEFRTATGSTTFEVTRVAQYPKAEIPDAEVYGASGWPELRLITCAGTFDRAARHYRDNVVVYATLVGQT